jgi:hypothetical protein
MDATTRVRWLEGQASQPLDPQLDRTESKATRFRPKTYQQLAKVLRESGQEVEAKRILIAKERARRKYGNLGLWAWLGHWVLGFSMANGYKPQRLLLGAAAFVVLGGWLFGEGYQAGTIVPAKKVEENSHYPSFDRWMYSLDTFLPIINFGQKDYWWPEASHVSPAILVQLAYGSSIDSPLAHTPRKTTWWTSLQFLRVYRWVHIGVGWLLITLGIAGITGLVRKE